LFKPAIEEFAQRLAHYAALQLEELPAQSSMAKEATALFQRLSPDERLVALDERGEALTSPQWAQLLGQAQLSSVRLAFVIGGDEGLDESVRRQAWRVLQLSSFTLPHRLARVVLLEQLYRAMTLIKGEPYHK